MIPPKLYSKILANIPIVCVDLLIEYNHHILLVQRKHEPLKGELFLPGGRLYRGESLEECAIRKAQEEVGKNDCLLGPMVHYQSTVYDTVHSVNFCFLMMAVNNKAELDDTSSAYEWVYIENIQPVNDYMEKCVKVLRRD